MSVFQSSPKRAERAVVMAKSILNDEKPEINAPEWFNLGEKFIPTYLCEFDIVTRENYKELLIDSGYYTQEEIDG